MKTTYNKHLMRKIFFVITAASVIICLNSCAKKITFLTSSVVPAAEGTVKVTKDNNKNYNIKIALSNLAEPKRLQPSKSMYVVWMETDNNATQNIGQINTSTGLFGGKLKSSFETVSSSKPTKIFLTAEDDAKVQYPGTQVVLSTDTF
jgi:hypothetical protein